MSELGNEGVRSMLAKIADLEARLKTAEAQLAGIAAGHVVWSYVDAEGSPRLAGQQFINTVRQLAGEMLLLATPEQRDTLWFCKSLTKRRW